MTVKTSGQTDEKLTSLCYGQLHGKKILVELHETNVLDKSYTSYYFQWLQLKLQMEDVKKTDLHLLENNSKEFCLDCTTTY